MEKGDRIIQFSVASEIWLVHTSCSVGEPQDNQRDPHVDPDLDSSTLLSSKVLLKRLELYVLADNHHGTWTHTKVTCFVKQITIDILILWPRGSPFIRTNCDRIERSISSMRLLTGTIWQLKRPIGDRINWIRHLSASNSLSFTNLYHLNRTREWHIKSRHRLRLEE